MIDLARSSSDVMKIEDTSPAAEDEKPKSSIFQQYSTFAVRGATIARPEGYCLCWDHELSKIESQIREATDDSNSHLRQQEHEDQLLRRRNRRRRELQREVLPRVLYSAPQKGIGEPQLGIRQPCIQFLNVDSSHAVRLFTPPFETGPVPAPVTVFCVGIATEDGCFLSGLRNRFEFGHLYPETARDDLIERSPICLCTGLDQAHLFGDSDNKNREQEDGKDASFNSDDSSCDMSLEAAGGDQGLKCVCPFTGLGNTVEEDDETQACQVCRGRRGPGTWHCYVAIFDGDSSSIRIDGVPEPIRIRCDKPIPSSAAAARLDGLTIGSDHTFDMSLCFGQGSEGEGQGAMAELAVFKGRLDTEDIETVERKLMTKHGIAPPEISGKDLAEEDSYSRLAHAMLSHAPYHKVFATGSKRVPLRYMVKHRTVSWKQTNPVTGEAIRVQRIGSKCGDSSSDW
jgi:hypothetical protein